MRHSSFSELVSSGELAIGDGYRAKNEELGGSGPIFLRAAYLQDDGFRFSQPDRFKRLELSSFGDKASQVNDTVITTKGNSLGRTGLIREQQAGAIYSPHLSYWRSKDLSALDPGFLYYWSRSPEFRSQCAAMAHSTDMAPYLSLRDQLRLRVTLPEPEHQRSVAHLLGALDDKIELNQRMNETLEALARVIFKSWFIDFDPVRAKAAGETPFGMDDATAALFPDRFGPDGLPEGWREATISKVAEVNAWTLRSSDELDEIEYIEISSVDRGQIKETACYHRGEEPSRARRRLRHGDTALSTVRPERRAYFLALNPSPNLIASTGFAVVTPKAAPWSFVHAALTMPEVFEELGHLADGAAYPAVGPEVVGSIGVARPDDPRVFEAYHALAAPLLELAHTNRQANHTLADIRDLLLPKLMSGEIRVRRTDDSVQVPYDN